MTECTPAEIKDSLPQDSTDADNSKEKVLSQKEKLAYERRTRVYKVQKIDQLFDAVKETRDMNRVPLFLRTPKNTLNLKDLKPKFAQAF